MRHILFAAAGLAALASGPALAQVTPEASKATATPSSPAPGEVSEVVVTARRLDAARTAIQTQLGASTTVIDRKTIEDQPGGANNALNTVVLQAPGVAQDSFGQLHVRGEHAGLQFRLNGVILPEGISAFGQTLNPRLADRVRLITGALPAEYGLRTAGVVDIATRSGAYANGGSIGVYGGAHDTLHLSGEASGSTAGGLNAFVSADFVRNDLGIESPDGRSTPLHDRTTQGNAFVFLEKIVSPDTRVGLVAGTARQNYEIPNQTGLQPTLGLNVSGRTTYASEGLDERQRQITHYAIGTYQRAGDQFDLQGSVFARFSSLAFTPDQVGDLLYDGIAQDAYKRDLAGGLQLEGAWRGIEDHTVRGGLILQADRSKSHTVSRVLPVDAGGNQTSTTPLVIRDDSQADGRTESLYVQDEWKIAPTFTVNYGLRWDGFHGYVDERQLSPRVNAVWNPGGGFTLHAGYARYFTPPPFELVADQTVALFAGTTAQAPGTGNDAPRAERADYFDIGVEQRVGADLTLGIDTYYKRSKNLIDEGQFGAPIILTPFNYADGRQSGVELTADYGHGPISAYANLAIGRAIGRRIVSSQFNFDPGDLAYIADHWVHLDHDQKITGSAGFAYRFGSATRVSADLIYGSGLRKDGATPNGDHLPAYVTANLGISQELDLGVAGPVTVKLDVVNLADKLYEIRDGSGIGVGAPQFGERRGVFVGLTKTFG